MKINNLEEEKLNLRLEIQNITKTKSHIQGKYKATDSKDIEVNDKSKNLDNYHAQYKEIVEENEALRRGFHEVLESIQKTTGTFMIIYFDAVTH